MNSVNNLTQYTMVQVSELRVVNCLDNEMGFVPNVKRTYSAFSPHLSVSATRPGFHKLSGIFIVGG